MALSKTMTGFNFNKSGENGQGKENPMQAHCDHLQGEIDELKRMQMQTDSGGKIAMFVAQLKIKDALSADKAKKMEELMRQNELGKEEIA